MYKFTYSSICCIKSERALSVHEVKIKESQVLFLARTGAHSLTHSPTPSLSHSFLHSLFTVVLVSEQLLARRASTSPASPPSPRECRRDNYSELTALVVLYCGPRVGGEWEARCSVSAMLLAAGLASST